ncbi:serine/threonine protein kinase [Catenulispora sp. EB89]|uniref:serine/threonine-protein kinase n=1 Tax=Catenulispora sp. EB89 TaxID=3156257 RepID=UPI0035111411
MEPLQDTDPRQIGPYEIIGLLGVGGMGRVYLGIGEGGTKAAVKVVNAELLRDEEFRKRFTREATATAKVRGRFIADIVAAEIDTPHPWLATEYIDGPALSDKVAKQGPLTASDAQQTAAGLAEALTTIHAAGVVHRDVKPANVLIAESGPHLIDFGIARDSAASTITRSGIVVGTPPYMAPEQIRGKK